MHFYIKNNYKKCGRCNFEWTWGNHYLGVSTTWEEHDGASPNFWGPDWVNPLSLQWRQPSRCSLCFVASTLYSGQWSIKWSRNSRTMALNVQFNLFKSMVVIISVEGFWKIRLSSVKPALRGWLGCSLRQTIRCFDHLKWFNEQNTSLGIMQNTPVHQTRVHKFAVCIIRTGEMVKPTTGSSEWNKMMLIYLSR